MSSALLKPMSGFPELLPNEQILFNEIVAKIRHGFEMSGAVPIETPAVERIKTLLRKGEIDKEVYGLKRLKEDGNSDDKDLALHFDLTVPLARYVAQHRGDLTFPFKRYQIQPVWRGEKPQVEKGRFRQFYQCDIDVIGNEELSLYHDAEMPIVVHSIFQELGIGEFVIGVNNRKLISGFLGMCGITGEQITPVVDAVDSIEKKGVNYGKSELEKIGVGPTTVPKILDFFRRRNSTEDTFRFLDTVELNESGKQGLDELREVLGTIGQMGIPSSCVIADLSVARGLDYYTGTIYETHLTRHRGIGSICSGGRFDNLTGQIGRGNHFPGVGISIGLSRLFPKLQKIGVIGTGSTTTAQVLVATMDSQQRELCLQLGLQLRKAGIKSEVYLEDRKLGSQMKFANRKGFPIVVIAGGNEMESESVVVRLMDSGDQFAVTYDELTHEIRRHLAGWSVGSNSR